MLVHMDEASLAALIADARAEVDGSYLLPGIRRLLDGLIADVRVMIAPFQAAGRSASGAWDFDRFERRLSVLSGQLPAADGDRIASKEIASLAAITPGEQDSLHLLVMDAHKALNALQAQIAQESIDGAMVYAIEDRDRPLIEAFMRGVNRTAPLKFDHPGLGTTATRSGRRLIIQNDIGTTDAHVLIIRIEDHTATLTCSDIHIARLRFFQSLFKGFDVTWTAMQGQSEAKLAGGGEFYVTTGTLRSEDARTLADYLQFLGSRIVFLIDWNRARKRLSRLVSKKTAIDVVRWGAENDVGHRGFLKLGGDQLVYGAIEAVAKQPLHYGEKLSAMLGEEQAATFLRFVLKTATEGFLAGRSERLMIEEIRAELMNYIETAADRLLDLMADHGALVLDLAGLVQERLLRMGTLSASEDASFTRRAKTLEAQADQLVIQVRLLVARTSGTAVYRQAVEAAEEAADELEEAAFHLGLLEDVQGVGSVVADLNRLAGLVVSCVQELLKCVATMRDVHRGAARQDVQDFLSAVDRLHQLEHATDDAERQIKAGLVARAIEARALYLVAEVAGNMEAASDALFHAALVLKDHALGERITS
jgi:uncharacterized protein Yka (UPF0111/DUF47 family)